MIIYSEVRTIDTEAGAENEFYADEFETHHEDNLESEVTHNKSLLPGPRSAEQHVPMLPGPCPAEYHVPEDIASMIEFDIMRSSPPANPVSATIDQGFLSSAVNWERRSIRDICARMPEVDRIRRIISGRFRLKARLWQISVLVNITHKKSDVCIIASTNTGKSLVYQAIPVVTGGLVLVISPTIALMEDQVRAPS